MSRYTYTTAAQVRAAFWSDARDGAFAPLDVTPRTIRDYSGRGRMHTTDTRCAFADYVDALARSGEISSALADRVTL